MQPKLRLGDENGNEFFGEWKEEKINNLIKKGKAGGTPLSSNKEEYYDNGIIPFLSINDLTIQKKEIKYTKKKITRKGLENSSAGLVPENSILYSLYASLGKVAINKIPLTTSQAIFSFILKENYNLNFENL